VDLDAAVLRRSGEDCQAFSLVQAICDRAYHVGPQSESTSEAPFERFCRHLHPSPRDKTLLPHQACKALKRKLAAMGKWALRALSNFRWFCRRPPQLFVVGCLAPPGCHLALVVVRAPFAVSGEDAQSGHRLATIRIDRLSPPSVSCLIGEQEKVTCGKLDIMRT
jgi:hypothetical protein